LIQSHIVVHGSAPSFGENTIIDYVGKSDDEPIVASVLAGTADVFVTGDKALLKLQSVEHLPIISPRNFWEILAGREKSSE
jgi:predicted nucleic acid-binding protein